MLFFQEKNKPQGDVTQSPRAMAKFLKEATRVKQVLSANSEIFAQVSIVLLKTPLSERFFYWLAYLTEIEQLMDCLGGLSIDANLPPKKNLFGREDNNQARCHCVVCT